MSTWQILVDTIPNSSNEYSKNCISDSRRIANEISKTKYDP